MWFAANLQAPDLQVGGSGNQGPLLLTWFNLNPSKDSNYIHYRVWDGIWSHTLLDIWLIIHAGIKINPC